jgi:anti-anti-sigma factor
MSVKLIQVGDFVTREFPIEVEEFNIGRDYTCDLRLDHGRVSRNHCRILKRGRRVLVEALYSSAGTAVNQKILDPNRPPTEVYDGDHLWVGPEHFQFVFTADPNDRDPLPESPADPGKPKISSTEIPSNPLLKDISTVQSRAANQLLERLSSASEAGAAPAPPAAEIGEQPTIDEGPPEPQGTLDVTQMEGVSLVRLLPKTIVADSDIRTITEELGELIDSGRNCITLHLGNVERMSSQVIGEVFQVYKRCKSKGGMLKICRVSPQVAGVFAMTKMERHIEIFPDERLALKSIWPRQAPAPSKAVEEKPHPAKHNKSVAAVVSTPPSMRVRLIVGVGRAKGTVVELRGPRFLIGRDRQCQLRPNSNAISRLHTAIEQREGRVFVIDLGSQIGTLLNDRLLRDEEAEVFHGDRLQVEALQFTFAIETHADPAPAGTKDESLSGLFGEQSTDSSADTTIMPLPDLSVVSPRPPAPLPTDAPDDKPKRLRHMVFEIVDDVAVITLLTHDLSDESIISAVRVELESILGHTGPTRYVLRFNHVRTIARGAVVMLLARAQHLHQTGGTLRICQVIPPVMEFLEKTQLPQLIDIYTTLDEAMHTTWEPEDQTSPYA